MNEPTPTPRPGGLVRGHVWIAWLAAAFWTTSAWIYDSGPRWIIAAVCILAALLVQFRVAYKIVTAREASRRNEGRQ